MTPDIHPTQIHQYAEQYATGGNYPSVPQTFQSPIVQGRAHELTRPFRTGFLVGLGFIAASLMPLGILIIIGVLLTSHSQPSTF